MQIQKDHAAFLEGQIHTLTEALFRATHITPHAESPRSGPTPEAVQVMPQPWGSAKSKLEAKYRRGREERKPEDAVAEHWSGKIKDLESQAGLGVKNAG